jgi:hypothetical protein
MQTFRLATIAAACFAAGALTRSGLAQTRKPSYEPSMLQGSPAEVGARFLEGALVLAEQGSWERIAVGRAWYRGGDRQQIFDGVTSSRKVEGSDWFRVARVYAEAASGRRRARRSTRRSRRTPTTTRGRSSSAATRT